MRISSSSRDLFCNSDDNWEQEGFGAIPIHSFSYRQQLEEKSTIPSLRCPKLEVTPAYHINIGYQSFIAYCVFLRPPSSPKQKEELDRFKTGIRNILSRENNLPIDDSPVLTTRNEDQIGKTDHMNVINNSGLLDLDVLAYFKQEKNDLVLKNLGYFEDDDFMRFK